MNIIGQIKDQVSGYADVYIKLFKLNFIQRTSGLVSYLMFAMIGLFILLGVFLFLGFGLIELFADLGLSRLASIFIVVGIYILMLVVLMLCRKPVTRFFAGGIISVLTEGDDETGGEDSEEVEDENE